MGLVHPHPVSREGVDKIFSGGMNRKGLANVELLRHSGQGALGEDAPNFGDVVRKKNSRPGLPSRLGDCISGAISHLKIKEEKEIIRNRKGKKKVIDLKEVRVSRT